MVLKNLKIIRMFVVDKKEGYWAISPMNIMLD